MPKVGYKFGIEGNDSNENIFKYKNIFGFKSILKFIQRFARYRNAALIWIGRLCSNSLESQLTVPGRATIFSRYSHSYNIPIQSCILRPIHLHLLHLTQCSAYYIHWMERCHLSVFEVLFYDQSDLAFKVASYVSTYVLSIYISINIDLFPSDFCRFGQTFVFFLSSTQEAQYNLEYLNK